MDTEKINELLLDFRKHAESEFEKLILYIASGGLVLTITFSEKIIQIDKSGNYLSWLIITWVCFALTILFSLIFHFTSIKAIDIYLSGKIETSKKWNDFTKLLQLFSIIILLFGITCFILYATLTVIKQ